MNTINTLLNKEEVQGLIPQKAPMVMIDSLLSSSEKRSVSSFQIKEENIFCDDNKLTESGLIENVAQTAAIRAGYMGMMKAKEEGNSSAGPILGYIAAVRNCIIHELPEVGTDIQTEIVVEHEVMSVSMINGKITSGDTLYLECEMKIFQKG